jgi:hypothetical protein
MTTQNKAVGLRTRTASNELVLAHFTARLAETKRLLVHGYASGALTFKQAEHIANALRRKFGISWRRA